MTDSYRPLFAAMMAAMKADGALTALVGQRIYGDVVDNPTFPYVVLTVSSAPFETKTNAGMEHSAQISIYSRKPSVDQCGQIRAAIYSLFNRNESALSSALVDSIMFNGVAPTFKEPDGQTWQGVIQFRVVIGD